jgi:hypothetical protein
MKKIRPIVRFAGEPKFFNWHGTAAIVASVLALDHPHLGCGMVRTSRVIRRNKDGSFVTLNTKYVPKEDV